MISVKAKGDFKKANSFFEKMKEVAHIGILDKYGRIGCQALAEATPKNSGKTAESWTYKIERTKTGSKIVWSNTNVNEGVNIAIILQYGHGTGTGGFVTGEDYINPAMKPVFDKIAEDAWKEVSKA